AHEVADATADTVHAAQVVAARETLPPRVALLRGRGALLVAVLAFVGFGAVFALVRADRSAALDAGITMKLQRRRWPALAPFMALVSWPGFPPQSRTIPPLLIGGMWLSRLRLEAGFQLLGWCTGLVSSALKTFMKRPRPVAGSDIRVVAAPLGGSSFPSGHVITYVGTYGFLAYLAHTLMRPRRLRRAVVTGLAGMLAMVGPSRIYQGHHWPTDVLASYLLGLSYLIGLTTLYRRLKGRTVTR
nr:phosphatase PAP2 family protein [Chloroflexota bacterium]